ncbi:uncharacterized protein LOC124172279 [Ischnura elegans]|uniref:uncharacterized protein LOC124172279 n=1 Tax=Ischnura elegans TaxID=197161 RepID=UPI001ED8B979|nr:uncharacterized protein LOC124172279 [Ischnura elegans]
MPKGPYSKNSRTTKWRRRKTIDGALGNYLSNAPVENDTQERRKKEVGSPATEKAPLEPDYFNLNDNNGSDSDEMASSTSECSAHQTPGKPSERKESSEISGDDEDSSSEGSNNFSDS